MEGGGLPPRLYLSLLILIPQREEIDPYELREMVCEVNQKEVEAQEVLSDQVYYYDRSSDRIQKI